MSGFVTGAVLDRYPGKGGERMVAVSLADNAHRDGTHIYPSVSEIASKSRLSERSVQVHIARMVSSGWLILTRRSTGRRGDTNEYRISPEWLAGGECVPPAGPVIRTNPKKPPATAELSGAETAPHDSTTDNSPWGAETGSVGCRKQRDGVKPTAPKPPRTPNNLNTPQPPDGGQSGFDEVFGVYPKQVDVGKARAQWALLAPDAAMQAAIMAAVLSWRDSPAWQADGGTRIPKLHNWLRNKGWLNVAGVAPLPRKAGPPAQPHQPLVAAPIPDGVRKLRESIGRLKVQAPAIEQQPTEKAEHAD